MATNTVSAFACLVARAAERFRVLIISKFQLLVDMTVTNAGYIRTIGGARGEDDAREGPGGARSFGAVTEVVCCGGVNGPMEIGVVGRIGAESASE